jgi:hypothetical protein
MSFGLLFTICIVLLAVLAFFLNYNWGDQVNPIQKTVIVLGLLAVAFYTADNLKSSDEDETAHLTHDPKSLILAHIYMDSVSWSGRIGLIVYLMAINNTTHHSLTIKSADLQFDDWTGETLTSDAILIWPGIVTGKPTILLTAKNGNSFYLEDWYNIKEQIANGKLLSPGEILGASACYLLPTSTVSEIRLYKNFRIVITDFAGHTSINPIKLLDTMAVISLHNKINSF